MKNLYVSTSWTVRSSESSMWELHWPSGDSKPSMTNPLPIGSMYAIYGNIYHQYTPNVSIYTIHGSYGLCIDGFSHWNANNFWGICQPCLIPRCSQSLGHALPEFLHHMVAPGRAALGISTVSNQAVTYPGWKIPEGNWKAQWFSYPLVNVYIGLKPAIEIVDFPIKNDDFPVRYVKWPEGISK